MPVTLVAALATYTLLAQGTTSASGPTISAAIEHRVERYRYHFDNPSNFDTVELVPHSFEQRYDASSTWVGLAATYRFFGGRGRTTAGFTPRRLTFASDIDTFFQPSGDVVTSGTSGAVRLQSFSLDQQFSVTSLGRWTVDVVLGYRRLQATFLPANLIVTHTQPASTTATFTTAREATVSRVLQSGVAFRRNWAPQARWRLGIESETMPIVRARLVTSLPDKYDHDVVADALAFSVSGSATIERQWNGLSAGVSIRASGAFGYRSASRYRQHGIGVALLATKRW